MLILKQKFKNIHPLLHNCEENDFVLVLNVDGEDTCAIIMNDFIHAVRLAAFDAA